jgi:hypothetical protein
MKLKKTIALINQQAARVIGRNAIGGAVGATFYLEPVATLDVNVFVALHPEPGQILITPKPIYDYLTSRGCKAEGEHLVIEGSLGYYLAGLQPLALGRMSSLESALRGAHGFLLLGGRLG